MTFRNFYALQLFESIERIITHDNDLKSSLWGACGNGNTIARRYSRYICAIRNSPFIFHKIKAPAIVGFLVTGILAGPQGFGLIQALDRTLKMIREIGRIIEEEIEPIGTKNPGRCTDCEYSRYCEGHQSED